MTDEFHGGIWWVPAAEGGVRNARPGECAAEIQRLRAVLRIIAGEAPCPDNLLGNADLARMALHGR